MKFGRIDIRDVRIRGLPSWAIGPITRLRTGKLRLEIGFNDAVTTAQWAQLCTGRSNMLQKTGVLLPYQDTANSVSEMVGYLHQNRIACLWYHPTADLMLVFYSPHSNAWMFLERMGRLHFDDSIRVLTRNKMPPTAMLAAEKDTFENTDASTAAGELRRPVRKRAQSLSALDIASDMVTDDSNFLSTSHSTKLLSPCCS
jgi:hypothetical protein